MRNLIGRVLLIIAAYILFINICIYLDIFQVAGLVDGNGHSKWYFEQYYFGVESFTKWLQDMPSSITNFNLLSLLLDTAYSLVGLNSPIDTGIEAFNIIIGILIGPFSFVNRLILGMYLYLNQFLLPLFGHIAKLLTGMYNLPVGDYPSVYYPDISITPVIL